MTAPLSRRREQLRALYGFDFPDDLFRFWEFANRLRPLEPLQALFDPLELTLVGPFDVLAGRCDNQIPRLSMVLHWRYHDDPPEFFTVLAGDTDGLHWGYYLDDPASDDCCVASYLARDAFELSSDGDNLFEAVRLHLEYCYRDSLEYEDDPAIRDSLLTRLDKLRETLTRFATGERRETSDAYIDRYEDVNARAERVVARTAEGMGIVVPRPLFRHIILENAKYWPYLKKTDDPVRVIEEAQVALADGFPGTTLKVGKDLWALGDERKSVAAFALLDAAYGALGRPVLRHILQTHRSHRDLPSVDVFENEAEGDGHS